MKVIYDGDTVEVGFNLYGNMFTLESTQRFREGEIEAYCCARRFDAKPNQCWLLKEFLQIFVDANILTPVMDGANMVVEGSDESEEGFAILCDIIHPEFNDGGYSPFGDFCRNRLGQQCQYGSRYITGHLEGYPALGEGLRFNNGKGYNGQFRPLDAADYHAIRIHRDDMDEFERRYRAYNSERMA